MNSVQKEQKKELEPHNDSHSQVEPPSGRMPASVIEKGPGSDLKKAFKESKEIALRDVLNQGDDVDVPSSVLDASAHLASEDQWARKPASVAALEKKDPLRAAKNQSSAPLGVKKLFERAPASQDKFQPVPGAFTVHVESFSTEDEARAKVMNLRKSGFDEAYFESMVVQSGERWFRVGVGSFEDRAWAQKMGDRLIHQKFASDYVVRKVP